MVSPKASWGLTNQSFSLIGLRNVGLYSHNSKTVGPELLYQRLCPLGAGIVVNCQVGSAGRQGLGNSLTDSLGPTGDQGIFARQINGHHPLCHTLWSLSTPRPRATTQQ